MPRGAPRHHSRNVCVGHLGQLAHRAPARHRQPPERAAAELRELLRPLVALLRREDLADDVHRQPLGVGALLLLPHDAPAQVDEHARDVDLDRARLVAGAAQRRRPRQRRRLPQPAQLRRQDRADRAGIDRLVGLRRRCASRPGTRSGTPSSGCSAAPGGRPRRRASACARCRAARGGTPSARRPRARRSTATCTGSSARRSRSAAAAAGRPRGRATPAAASRSPSRSRARRAASCTCARCPRTRRPRPSRSPRSRSSRPRSPPAPTGTSRAGGAAPPRRSPSPPSRGPAPWAIVRSNRRRISARFLWIAGTRMCDERSPASWMISSARSVSIASIPSACERLVELDLVGGDRLDLDHLARAVVLGDPGHDRVRLGRVARPVHDAAGARHRRLEPLELLGQRRHRARLDRRAGRRAAPPSRRARRSRASRLARIVVVALPRLRRSCASCSVSWAAAGKPFIPAPPGSRPGAPRARRSAACAARRRCASGTSCRPTCRPPRACRARGAACRRASPSRCRRS